MDETKPTRSLNGAQISGGKVVCRRLSGALSGTSGGLTQPVMFAYISTLLDPKLDLSDLDRYGTAVTGEPFDEGSDCNGDVALLKRLDHWYAALHRSVNLPIFDESYVDGAQLNKETGLTDWKMVLPTIHPALSQKVMQWLIGAMNTWLGPTPPDQGSLEELTETLSVLKANMRRYSLQGTNMIRILAAAHKLRLPFNHLSGDIFAIGTGKHSRWFKSTLTDKTTYLGCTLAKNKLASADMLRKFCFPVPEHRYAPSEDEAVKIAGQLGYPVVIKPADQDQGRGVYAGLRNEKSLRKSYQAALDHSKVIMVERHHEGVDHRITVMHNEVIKVMRRDPASIIGDGESSVEAHIERLQLKEGNQRALKRDGKHRISLDEEVMDLLAEQGLTAASIPAVGQKVVLRRKSNISVGGEHHLVPLDNVHPDNCSLAIRAANLLKLDFAGVDLIIADISKPWHQNGAVICEVNAQPQLGYRETPELYELILKELFKHGDKIPIYLLPVDSTENLNDTFLKTLAGHFSCNAISSPHGMWRDGYQIAWAPGNGFNTARALLFDKMVSAGLVIMTFEEIQRWGLPVSDFQELALSDKRIWNSEIAQRVRSRLDVHLRNRGLRKRILIPSEIDVSNNS